MSTSSDGSLIIRANFCNDKYSPHAQKRAVEFSKVFRMSESDIDKILGSRKPKTMPIVQTSVFVAPKSKQKFSDKHKMREVAAVINNSKSRELKEITEMAGSLNLWDSKLLDLVFDNLEQFK